MSAWQRGDGAVLPAGVQRLRGDRADAMVALAAGNWDACVDIGGYFPRARRSPGCRRYVSVNAVSVYGEPAAGPVTEVLSRVAPAADDLHETHDGEAIDDTGYAPLKVACEDVVQAAFGHRATRLRPQVVAGAGDQSERVAYGQDRPDGPFPGDSGDWLQRGLQPPVLPQLRVEL